MNWIRAEDELPGFDECVLLYCETNGEITVGHVDRRLKHTVANREMVESDFYLLLVSNDYYSEDEPYTHWCRITLPGELA